MGFRTPACLESPRNRGGKTSSRFIVNCQLATKLLELVVELLPDLF